MSNIKYAKQRNGDIFYPRTVAEAVRFKDGENLDTKMAKNFYPISSEEEAIKGENNSSVMTPRRVEQVLKEKGTLLNVSYHEKDKVLSFRSNL